MVSQWGARKVRSSKVRLNVQDRISQTDNSVMICNVLSRLPTKDAVKTSVLSTSWRSLWLESPCWELSSLDFPDLSSFRSFGHRVFDPTRVSCIRKLKLAIGEKDASYLTPWFSASDRRKIQHLHVKCCAHEHIPVLPKMRLKAILYPNEATFERLVSSCPVLEELEIDECLNDDALIFRVCEGDYDYMNEESLSSVPECLTLSLEFVYLEVPIEGHPGEMKLVRYFLQNSAILKKLTLHSVREKSTLIELRRIRRGSTQCELEVLQTN